jgi:hypothetical protein
MIMTGSSSSTANGVAVDVDVAVGGCDVVVVAGTESLLLLVLVVVVVVVEVEVVVATGGTCCTSIDKTLVAIWISSTLPVGTLYNLPMLIGVLQPDTVNAVLRLPF